MEFFLSVFWCIVLDENKEEEWAYFMQPVFFELPDSSQKKVSGWSNFASNLIGKTLSELFFGKW